MTKQRIMVLYGGKADEHSISCISTAGMLNALDTERFEPVPVGITKDGKWLVGGTDPRTFSLDGGELPVVQASADAREVVLDPARGADGFFAREQNGTLTSLGHIDAVFPVLHLSLIHI